VGRLLGENAISVPPVVDDQGKMVAIISEADVMRREEVGTVKHRPWWLEAMTPATTLADDFARLSESALRNHVPEVFQHPKMRR
jgi:hypothetical protein